MRRRSAMRCSLRSVSSLTRTISSMVWRRRKRSRSEGPGMWALSGGDMRCIGAQERMQYRLEVRRLPDPSSFCTMTVFRSQPKAYGYSMCGYDIAQVYVSASNQRLTGVSRTTSTGQNGLGMPPFLNPVMYDSQITVRPCTLCNGPRSSCSHWLSIMFQIHLGHSGEREAVQLAHPNSRSLQLQSDRPAVL